MSRITIALIVCLVAAAGCSSTPRSPEGASQGSDAVRVHRVGTTCCGSFESDVDGCTSDRCCAVTGEDCGNAQCVCRPLVVNVSAEGAK